MEFWEVLQLKLKLSVDKFMDTLFKVTAEGSFEVQLNTVTYNATTKQ